MWSTGGENHGVVKLKQLVDRDVRADCDIADEADAVGLRYLVVALRNRFQRLMVGRHAEADQAIRHRIFVDDVDLRAVAK